MENKQDKGFTLVELLIVIVILGILATVTVFAVRGITDRGQDNACAVDKRTAETAIEAFYAEKQVNPANINDLFPGYLKSDPTAGASPNLAITFVPGPPVGIPTVAYAGKCL
jgi:prepilin-type N-terminal cleavage/methylation domain-containing protein